MKEDHSSLTLPTLVSKAYDKVKGINHQKIMNRNIWIIRRNTGIRCADDTVLISEKENKLTEISEGRREERTKH